MMPASVMLFLDFRTDFEKALDVLRVDKSHNVFDAGAVVEAMVENGDLSGGGKTLDVALNVHLGLLRSEGAGSATTRKTRGLTRSVMVLIVPPLPPASRPSNRTIATPLRPLPIPAHGKVQLAACLALFRKAFASSCHRWLCSPVPWPSTPENDAPETAEDDKEIGV
jgi:hypothetical protein